MKSQKQKSSIVKKMMIAVAAGFGVGIICLYNEGTACRYGCRGCMEGS